MEGSSVVSFAEEVMRLMSGMMRGAFKIDNSMLAKKDVTFSQIVSLDLLNTKGMLKMKDIAASLNISLPAVTGLVDRLHKIGMVKRVLDKADRRVIYVRLTNKGEKALLDFRSKRRELIEKTFSKLTEEERTSYINILRKLKDIISSEKNEK